MSKAWEKLIVALDVTEQKKYKDIIAQLAPQGCIFKVGPIAYFEWGPKTISWVHQRSGKVFFDFKLYDIPNTMLATAKHFVDMGVWAFTVHVKAGQESLKFLRKELRAYAKQTRKTMPLIIGVTELTSSESSLDSVMSLAAVAQDCRLDGVVASVWEAKAIKARFNLKVITPGIRNGRSSDDQKRIASAATAIEQGADYFVVGRPIVNCPDYLAAAKTILAL